MHRELLSRYHQQLRKLQRCVDLVTQATSGIDSCADSNVSGATGMYAGGAAVGGASRRSTPPLGGADGLVILDINQLDEDARAPDGIIGAENADAGGYGSGYGSGAQSAQLSALEEEASEAASGATR